MKTNTTIQTDINLEELADEIHANAIAKGFHDFTEDDYTFMSRELLNTIGEIAELQEAHRDGTLGVFCDKSEKMAALGFEPLTCREEEYADILIRTIDQMKRLCKQNGKTITQIVLTKHAYNKSRPFKHGRKH